MPELRLDEPVITLPPERISRASVTSRFGPLASPRSLVALGADFGLRRPTRKGFEPKVGDASACDVHAHRA